MPALPKCTDGHQQPQAGGRFCIYCGKGLVSDGQGQATGDQASRASQVQQPPPGQVPAVPTPPADPHYPPPQQAPPNYPPQGFVPGPVPQANYTAYPPPTYPAYPPQYPYPQPPQYSQYPQYPQYVVPTCSTCGGDPSSLPDKVVVCRECRGLKPLAPGYYVDTASFAWAADATAMAALRALKPLNMAANAVSERVGRRWIEAAFNGVLLSEKQMPNIFSQAVRAARILGISHMPDVYISGERPWDCLTFGTEKDSFIVIGSAVAGNFQGVDLLFLLARQMGHSKAGHALWRTVIRFFLGEQGPAKGVLSGGIFNALSPTALIGGAIEMPLLAWARQSEITADRAALLAVGREDIARRALLAWSLKSSFILKQLNIDAWLEQEGDMDDSYVKLSELMTSSTPYLTPRLRLMKQFARSPEFAVTLKRITDTIKAAAPPRPPEPTKPENDNAIRFKCSACETPIKIARTALQGKDVLPVKCPDAKCGAITRLKKNARPRTAPPRPKHAEENMNDGE